MAELSWQHFASARPDLAEGGKSSLYQFGVGLAFLSTVRPDGGPRLHPLCSGGLAALRCAATALTAASLASDSER